MPDFQIGLSGLQVAQRALEIIGTNIANASTEGYHRQDVKIASVALNVTGGVALGGSEIAEVRRALDVLLENELLRQRPQLGQVSQELLALHSLESALGDLSTEGLLKAVTGFFGALQELAAQPNSQPFQEQAVRAADTLAKQLQSIGRFLLELGEQIRLEGEHLISRVNSLSSEIASLNQEISIQIARGNSPNLLLDRRDQAIAELAELAQIRADDVPGRPGVVNVTAWGTPLVVGSSAIELEIGISEGNQLGVSVKDSGYYMTNLSGGRIGGLLSLKNSILAEVQDRLDALAREIIYNVNRHHVQGVGSAGSFTAITGWPANPAQLSDWDGWGPCLREGSFYVRVTDRTAGTTQQHEVSVLATDTVQTIAAKLDALGGLTGGVVDSALRIGVEDQTRYRFDFLPVPITTLQAGWSGTVQPAVSGIYSGEQDQLFTCTVTTGGTVGLTQGLTVEVRNEANELVAALNPGLGYAAGDRLQISEGLYAAFGTGTLTDGEQFTIRALANSDSSGFLAAAGVNTFFKGNSAASIAVDDEVLATFERLAFAVGQDMNDNTNARRMAELGEQPLLAMGGVCPADACRMIMTSVGQRINFSESKKSSLESMMNQMLNQRDQMSGVDLNDEASKMLIFENMFQALAKVVSTQDSVLQMLMELV
ncbi:MAG: hypothetical protein AMJ81_02485 [Phycisphaerae bacterium SM23_33]|nr:MAG: hypothetical protein AMJ81_02485 [Phycisphaerae bacterium SM23_33]